MLAGYISDSCMQSHCCNIAIVVVKEHSMQLQEIAAF
jgi:hypothetical protein